jgi:CMP-N,N'-diacetyllegionaminic acid synthase
MKEIFCFIPAKGASKRLKKKNIVPILGKELLGYVIDSAKESKLFDEIIVSTEDEEVASIAQKYKANIVFRDKKLSFDPYGVSDVLFDFLEKNSAYQKYKNVMILLPTTPTLEGDDLVKAYGIFKSKNCKVLMSITETKENAFTSVVLENGFIKPIFKDKIFKKSQELPKTYDLNASITILNIEKFLREKTYFMFPMCSYILDNSKSVDINTKDDLVYAEFLLKRLRGVKK